MNMRFKNLIDKVLGSVVGILSFTFLSTIYFLVYQTFPYLGLNNHLLFTISFVCIGIISGITCYRLISYFGKNFGEIEDLASIKHGGSYKSPFLSKFAKVAGILIIGLPILLELNKYIFGEQKAFSINIFLGNFLILAIVVYAIM